MTGMAQIVSYGHQYGTLDRHAPKADSMADLQRLIALDHLNARLDALAEVCKGSTASPAVAGPWEAMLHNSLMEMED